MTGDSTGVCYGSEWNCQKTSSCVIAHLQIASDEDIRLMGQYGIIASIQPYWFLKVKRLWFGKTIFRRAGRRGI